MTTGVERLLEIGALLDRYGLRDVDVVRLDYEARAMVGCAACGAFYVGAKSGQVARIDVAGEVTRTRVESGVRALVHRCGAGAAAPLLLAGGDDGRIWRIEERPGKLEKPPEPAPAAVKSSVEGITALVEVEPGCLALATRRGKLRFQPLDTETPERELDVPGWIQWLFCAQGEVVGLTRGGEVCRVRRHGELAVERLPVLPTSALLLPDGGTLLVGTTTGLLRYQRARGALHALRRPQLGAAPFCMNALDMFSRRYLVLGLADGQLLLFETSALDDQVLPEPPRVFRHSLGAPVLALATWQREEGGQQVRYLAAALQDHTVRIIGVENHDKLLAEAAELCRTPGLLGGPDHAQLARHKHLMTDVVLRDPDLDKRGGEAALAVARQLDELARGASVSELAALSSRLHRLFRRDEVGALLAASVALLRAAPRGDDRAFRGFVERHLRDLHRALGFVEDAAARAHVIFWQRFVRKYLLLSASFSNKLLHVGDLARRNLANHKYVDALVYFSLLYQRRYEADWDAVLEVPARSVTCVDDVALIVGEDGRLVALRAGVARTLSGALARPASAVAAWRAGDGELMVALGREGRLELCALASGAVQASCDLGEITPRLICRLADDLLLVGCEGGERVVELLHRGAGGAWGSIVPTGAELRAPDRTVAARAAAAHARAGGGFDVLVGSDDGWLRWLRLEPDGGGWRAEVARATPLGQPVTAVELFADGAETWSFAGTAGGDLLCFASSGGQPGSDLPHWRDVHSGRVVALHARCSARYGGEPILHATSERGRMALYEVRGARPGRISESGNHYFAGMRHDRVNFPHPAGDLAFLPGPDDAFVVVLGKRILGGRVCHTRNADVRAGEPRAELKQHLRRCFAGITDSEPQRGHGLHGVIDAARLGGGERWHAYLELLELIHVSGGALRRYLVHPRTGTPGWSGVEHQPTLGDTQELLASLPRGQLSADEAEWVKTVLKAVARRWIKRDAHGELATIFAAIRRYVCEELPPRTDRALRLCTVAFDECFGVAVLEQISAGAHALRDEARRWLRHCLGASDRLVRAEALRTVARALYNVTSRGEPLPGLPDSLSWLVDVLLERPGALPEVPAQIPILDWLRTTVLAALFRLLKEDVLWLCDRVARSDLDRHTLPLVARRLRTVQAGTLADIIDAHSLTPLLRGDGRTWLVDQWNPDQPDPQRYRGRDGARARARTRVLRALRDLWLVEHWRPGQRLPELPAAADGDPDDALDKWLARLRQAAGDDQRAAARAALAKLDRELERAGAPGPGRELAATEAALLRAVTGWWSGFLQPLPERVGEYRCGKELQPPGAWTAVFEVEGDSTCVLKLLRLTGPPGSAASRLREEFIRACDSHDSQVPDHRVAAVLVPRRSQGSLTAHLDRLRADGRLDAAARRMLVAAAAPALVAALRDAHGRRRTHGHIHPGNVLVHQPELPRLRFDLVDFGMHRALSRSDDPLPAARLVPAALRRAAAQAFQFDQPRADDMMMLVVMLVEILLDRSLADQPTFAAVADQVRQQAKSPPEHRVFAALADALSPSGPRCPDLDELAIAMGLDLPGAERVRPGWVLRVAEDTLTLFAVTAAGGVPWHCATAPYHTRAVMRQVADAIAAGAGDSDGGIARVRQLLELPPAISELVGPPSDLGASMTVVQPAGLDLPWEVAALDGVELGVAYAVTRLPVGAALRRGGEPRRLQHAIVISFTRPVKECAEILGVHLDALPVEREQIDQVLDSDQPVDLLYVEGHHDAVNGFGDGLTVARLAESKLVRRNRPLVMLNGCSTSGPLLPHGAEALLGSAQQPGALAVIATWSQIYQHTVEHMRALLVEAAAWQRAHERAPAGSSLADAIRKARRAELKAANQPRIEQSRLVYAVYGPPDVVVRLGG